MIMLAPSRASSTSLKILCLGSHADDIEIGCGGTLLRLMGDYRNISVDWVVFSASRQREREALRSATLFLRRGRTRQIAIEHFEDGFFPFAGAEIKTYMHRLSRRCFPDLIFTHCRTDLHQDHRLIAELTSQVFRDHLIVEYEIPKYDGDLGSPNAYCPLTPQVCRRKIRYIMETFNTQRHKPWFTESTFLSLLRLRGVESKSPGGYAEAFYCRKLRLAV